jgi:polysaccharide pyruvyl transferase WcaK-like protein
MAARGPNENTARKIVNYDDSARSNEDRGLQATATARSIGLLGCFGVGNSGNDGSLETVVNYLADAFPQAKLMCICGNPTKIEERYGLPAISDHLEIHRSGFGRVLNKALLGIPGRWSNWSHSLREVRKLDVLVIPGTGILDDFQAGPMGWPYLLFRWCIAARLSGTEIAFLSIGAGPIVHPLSKWLMKAAAGMAGYRSYRDTISRDYMRNIGFDVSKDAVYPDIAFALPTPELPDAGNDNEGALTVGLGVMAYRGWSSDAAQADRIYDTYLSKMATFAAWLIGSGYNVRLLTGDAGDVSAVNDLLARLGEVVTTQNARVIAEPTESLHELMNQLAQTDLVVATRFHNVVCALKMRRPIVSIGYARKNDVLMADMGLEPFCQHIETLDVDLLKRQFEQLATERHVHMEAIQKRVDTYRQRLDNQFAALTRMVDS